MKNFAFLLGAAGLFAAHAVAQQGNLDSVTCPNIYGWAFTQAYVTAYVDVYDGPTLVQSNIPANQYRGDLAAAGYDNGYHGFSFAPPSALLDRRLHQVYVKFSGTNINVSSTPQAIQCTGTSLGYTYYLQSTFTDTSNWNSYGSVSISGNLFTSNDSSGAPGRWISSFAVPDGSSNYEVKSILSLKQSGGTYIHYLHATGDPMNGGSGIEIALSDPQFSGSACTANLSVNDINNGTLTNVDAQWTVPCADGMEIRSVILPPSGGISWLGIMVGGTEVWAVSSITSGQPGIGAIDTPSGNGLSFAALGPRDAVAPGNVDGSSIKTYVSVQPTGAAEVDLSWDGVVDNPNDMIGDGVGIWYYLIWRDGSLIGTSVSTDFVDAAVNAGDSHYYYVYAQDWHGNTSA
jgi:hypothetical protein